MSRLSEHIADLLRWLPFGAKRTCIDVGFSLPRSRVTQPDLTALHRLLDPLCLSGASPSMESSCACDARHSFPKRDRGAHDSSTPPISTSGSSCRRAAGRLASCKCARLSKPDGAHRRRLSPWTGNRHLGAPDG